MARFHGCATPGDVLAAKAQGMDPPAHDFAVGLGPLDTSGKVSLLRREEFVWRRLRELAPSCGARYTLAEPWPVELGAPPVLRPADIRSIIEAAASWRRALVSVDRGLRFA